MKTFMSDWRDRYEGRPAAVLGGGPSLPADMARLPEGCVLIAVNHHALRLCTSDFVVFNDDPAGDMLEKLTEDGGRKTESGVKTLLVSTHKMSDIIFDVEVWTGFYSSNTAAWFGLWLGCDPVILCGMDCYQGPEKYFYERNCEPAPSWDYGLEDHVRPWVEEGRYQLPHVERVRVMSGPLVGVFGEYRPLTADRRPKTEDRMVMAEVGL